MFLELRFVIGLIGMSKPGIEDFPSIVALGPGDWMLIPHFSSLVAFFIQIHQHMQSVLHILEIIPFIFVPPDRIEVLGGRMFSVQHINFGFLYSRMRRKIRPYKAVIPWPIKLSIRRCMDTHKPFSPIGYTAQKLPVAHYREYRRLCSER